MKHLSSIYTPFWVDQLAFFADQPAHLGINWKKLVLSCLIPPKNHINSCPVPNSLSVLSDWPVMQLLDCYCFKMAAILLLLGQLAPNDPCFDPNLNSFAQNGCHFPFTWSFGYKWSLFAPCSSPDLISSAQNGFHFLWVAHLTINCSKWLPIHDYLAVGCSKWLQIYLYSAFWLYMLPIPVQTW